MQIRPHSTIQSHQYSRIHSNQQFGYFFKLTHQGKQTKVNKQGQLVPKFVENFTGFINFKQRKNQSFFDKNLMYSQPNLKYKKQKNPVHPKGSKFQGYAQFPYNLKGNVPQFLQKQTFKQSCETRNIKNPLKKSSLTNNIRYSQNIESKKQDYVHKTKQQKSFNNQCDNFISFNEMKQNIQEKSFRLQSRKMRKQDKNEKSVILDAGQKYSTMQRIKSANCKSQSSFRLTNVSNEFTRESHANRQPSYFSQSLFNIQRTQTPNFIYTNTNEQMLSSISSDSSSYPFNQSSIKSKCYQSSCHHTQYIPKRRYKKEQNENNTVSLNDYQNQLQLQKKESQLVLKLKDSLKIYQPVPVQKPDNNTPQSGKKGAKDNKKPNSTQGSDKLKK